MKGEKIAVFVFLFSTILAILVGIFNVNVVSLSPLGTEYAEVIIATEDGEVLYLANKDLMKNYNDRGWGPIPSALFGKDSVDYHVAMGNEINLNLVYLNLDLASNSQHKFYLLFATDKEDDIHVILKRVPNSGVRGSVTGAVVHDGEGDGVLSDEIFPPREPYTFSLPIQLNDSNDTNSSGNSRGCPPYEKEWSLLHNKPTPYVVDWDWGFLPPIQKTEAEMWKYALKCLPNKYRAETLDKYGNPPFKRPSIGADIKVPIYSWEDEHGMGKLGVFFGEDDGEYVAGFSLTISF